MSDSKIFTDAPLYTGDEGLYAALIGTLAGLMDPNVDELDAYEIAKEVLEATDQLDYEILELIIARIKMATVPEDAKTWN